MKRIPKDEIVRYYKIEKDPNPNLRVLACDFEYDTDEEDWH